MNRWLRPATAYLAGVLLALGALRMAFRMIDGGAPWPAAALMLATGVVLVLLLLRFRSGRKRRAG
ncbi:hypothetical protein KKR91_13720 [Arthrobacter jiangjiafuii]|uniref:Uncharacterized protein n=1 Tax=Arthrobacter jiangjiafuii TaxID=2817475 RepID=A0A975QZV2_9MICC|nr:hypothetical protein [Arthrobacter jiangjiafuii]MBP3042758.1 hypothetical protein [Arthrobacter jiangjiafuii]QWC09527.1 hypothetical protein KKR91_13720 [Arthrobacter jiangjiafuii]